MRRAFDRPNALKAATAAGVLETLQAANTSLDKIHKCLEVRMGIPSQGDDVITPSEVNTS